MRGKGANGVVGSGVLFEVEERHCPDGHVIIMEIGAQRSALVLVAASDEHTDDLGAGVDDDLGAGLNRLMHLLWGAVQCADGQQYRCLQVGGDIGIEAEAFRVSNAIAVAADDHAHRGIELGVRIDEFADDLRAGALLVDACIAQGDADGLFTGLVRVRIVEQCVGESLRA